MMMMMMMMISTCSTLQHLNECYEVFTWNDFGSKETT